MGEIYLFQQFHNTCVLHQSLAALKHKPVADPRGGAGRHVYLSVHFLPFSFSFQPKQFAK